MTGNENSIDIFIRDNENSFSAYSENCAVPSLNVCHVKENFSSCNISNLSGILQVRGDVFTVDFQMILKAPMIAAHTMIGFTFELVVKDLGLKPEKTSFGANQFNKAPLNVVGRVSFDIFHGNDFKYQFQALICSGVGRVCIGGNTLLCQGITPLP